MHGVEVAAFDPAIVDARLFQAVDDSFVGVDDDTVGVWDIVAEQDAGHAFARAVFNAVAGIDNDAAVVFQLLQSFDGRLLAAHVEDDAFLYKPFVELVFAVNVYCTAAFAQLVGSCVEYGGVVSDVVWRIGAGSHDSGNYDFRHVGFWFNRFRL